jgi:hypothetical protein
MAKQLHFLPGTRVARAKAFTLTADDFVRHATEHGRSATFTWNERFTGTTVVKPYFDFDKKYEEEPTDAQLRADEAKMKDVVREVFPGIADADIVLATRHGWWKDGKTGKRWFKCSVRAWALGRKVRARDMPALVRQRMKKVPKELDLTIFKETEQLIGCVLACKDGDDPKRYLTPVDATVPLNCYLVQHVQETDEMISPAVVAGGSVAAAKKRGRPKKNPSLDAQGSPSGGGPSASREAEVEDAALREGLEEEGGGADTAVVTLSGDEYSAALQDASDCFGREYRMQETLEQIKVMPERNCFIFPTREKWCILKGQRGGRHEGNNPYIVVNEKGAVFRCLDAECKAKGGPPGAVQGAAGCFARPLQPEDLRGQGSGGLDGRSEEGMSRQHPEQLQKGG